MLAVVIQNEFINETISLVNEKKYIGRRIKIQLMKSSLLIKHLRCVEQIV